MADTRELPPPYQGQDPPPAQPSPPPPNERVLTLLERIAVGVERLVTQGNSPRAPETHQEPRQGYQGPPPYQSAPPGPPGPSGGGWGQPVGPPQEPVNRPGVCPVHGQPWAYVPAGYSERTQRSYPAFYACPERGCKEKPGGGRG